MTKHDLIEMMAAATGCTKACAGKALDGAIEAITKAVKKVRPTALKPGSTHKSIAVASLFPRCSKTGYTNVLRLWLS